MEFSSLTFDPSLARQLQRDLAGEIFKAVKCPDIKVLQEIIRFLVNLPTRRFAEIMADFDRVIKENGLRHASKHLLNKLTDNVTSAGEEIIPRKGPTIIASNHPGTYDGLTILSQLPREDIKIVAGANPFFRNLPNGRNFLIFATREHHERVELIRQSIRHLKDGGLVLIFPAGHIDPDPEILPGAEECLRKWSHSVAVFLKKVPKTKLILAITSGVITKEFINHPLPNMFKIGYERRRIVEFMQLIKHMVFGRGIPLTPRVSFDKEKMVDGKADFDLSERMSSIYSQALDLLHRHMDDRLWQTMRRSQLTG